MSGVDVRGLCVEVDRTGQEIVHDVSFAVAPGELLGMVGESGCGKTTVALAVLGGARAGARVTRGEVAVDGRSMRGLSRGELRRRRGRDVAYVSQDPAAALNPSLRIERQLKEPLDIHAPEMDDREAHERLVETLGDVRLPRDREFLQRYPHQLSGGQQQRVAIAMAAILRPPVIVMDEPTTGLDVTTQAHLLQTVRDLCRKHHVAILYVSHDLAVIGAIADRVLVLYAGRAVEYGPTHILSRPVHPYTRALIGAIPVVSESRVLATLSGRPPGPSAEVDGCAFAPRCAFRLPQCADGEPALAELGPDHVARCLRAVELTNTPLIPTVAKTDGTLDSSHLVVLEARNVVARYGAVEVLHGVSLQVRTQECVAVVGESGSGKTTLGRAIVGLHPDWDGEILYRGSAVERHARDRTRQARQNVQFIFQSPYNALNPRRTAGESVAAPLRELSSMGGRDRQARVATALAQVSLSSGLAGRYPDQLSGGERQRVAIARALVTEPDVLICDEITSALDVSVQASIVELLGSLLIEHQLAVVFVTHNLALVRSIAQRVVVLHRGSIVESGETSAVLGSPSDVYTRALVDDTPALPSVAR